MNSRSKSITILYIYSFYYVVKRSNCLCLLFNTIFVSRSSKKKCFFLSQITVSSMQTTGKHLFVIEDYTNGHVSQSWVWRSCLFDPKYCQSCFEKCIVFWWWKSHYWQCLSIDGLFYCQGHSNSNTYVWNLYIDIYICLSIWNNFIWIMWTENQS